MDKFIKRSFHAAKLTRERDMRDALDKRDFRLAASCHPVLPALAETARLALEDVRCVHMGAHGTLKDCVTKLRGNRGSLVGTLFEFFLVSRLSTHGFRDQAGKHEPDAVHISDPMLSFEIKTTSISKEEVFGNRVASSSAHKEGSFLLAVSYDISSLMVHRVRFGWVEPSDWIAQRGNGQQARLSEEARLRMLSLL